MKENLLNYVKLACTSESIYELSLKIANDNDIDENKKEDSLNILAKKLITTNDTQYIKLFLENIHLGNKKTIVKLENKIKKD